MKNSGEHAESSERLVEGGEAHAVGTTSEPKMYAWKHLSDGRIYEDAHANSKEELFEIFGFGAVEVDKPIKGFLAIEVGMVDGHFVEVEPQSSEALPTADAQSTTSVKWGEACEKCGRQIGALEADTFERTGLCAPCYVKETDGHPLAYLT